MYADLAHFKMADRIARHAFSAVEATSQNIANADTPGFKAIMVTSFQEEEKRLNLSTKSLRHLPESKAEIFSSRILESQEASPNGNTVSLEREALNAIEAKREHDLALALYRHGLTQLRSTIARS